MTGLQQLPDAVLEHVFSYVEPAVLWQIRATSSTFAKLSRRPLRDQMEQLVGRVRRGLVFTYYGFHKNGTLLVRNCCNLRCLVIA